MTLTLRLLLPTVLVLVATAQVGAEEPRRPNVLIFIADDHGEGDLGCYGHPTLKTPGMDRLAREGMRFDSAFLTISSCSPSRTSILTGRYPHNTGAEDLHAPLPPDQKTVARRLGDAGYHRVAIGKWHLGDAEKRHWDEIVPCPARRTAQETLNALKKRPREKPFFFWVASSDPHRSFEVNATEPPYVADDVIVPAFLPDHPLVRKDLAAYYGEVARFARQIEEVLEALSVEGTLDETFIVYLSDNGMPFPRAKTTLYDSGIRTPLLVRYPPLVRAGSVQKGLVSSIDLAPTVLELAGQPHDTLDGRSFLPLLRDEDAPGRDAIFAEANWHDFEQFSRAVRTERFLLVRNYYSDRPLWTSADSIHSITWQGILEFRRAGRLTPAQKFIFLEPRPFEEFYDLQLDPASLENVVTSVNYAKALNDLRTRLDNWRVETGDRMPATRRLDGWTRDGNPTPNNNPWYERWKKAKQRSFDKL